MQHCYIDCKYLNVTEAIQDSLRSKSKRIFRESKGKKKQPYPSNHMCNKYNKRVYHYTYHPALIMLDECDYKGDK